MMMVMIRVRRLKRWLDWCCGCVE